MPARTPPPLVLDLSPSASRFLDIVVELAHLDEKALAEVNDKLLDAQGDEGQISLEELRRVVAIVLDTRIETLEPDQRQLMRKEWPILFG